MKSLATAKYVRNLTSAGTVALLLALASPAQAQEPSPNVTANLIRLLVEQKVITQQAGDALLAQAEAEAQTAQAKIAAATPPPPAEGAVRIPYVPQVVKDQIRDEVRQEVLAQAKTEGWATPGNVPEWVSRVKVTGDVRFRSQSNLFSKTNANDFIDFQRFNANGPTDFNETADANTLPLLNSREDRVSQFSIRVRLGVEADLAPGVRAAIRLASGNDNGPASTTGVLGGGFSKKDIWLDQAFITLAPVDFATLTVGRMPNPFVSSGRAKSAMTDALRAGSRDPMRFGVSDLLFDEDLNFDGVALTLDSGERFGSGLNLAVTGGAFPFEQLGEDDPVTSLAKTDAPSKWILGGQARLGWNNEDFGAKLAVGYFDFSRVRGQISEPCLAYVGAVDCSTDYTRPSFIAKGNTLMYLRQIVADPTNPNFYAKPQYVGLVNDYNVLEVSGQVHADIGDELRVSLNGTYVKNLAFDRNDICANLPFGLPLTNVTGVTVSVPDSTTGGRANVLNTNPCSAVEGSTAVNGGSLLASYDSGDTAWMVQGWVGSKGLRKGGEWSVGLGYKWIEPDAVLDSLTDSDFHLGGTNAKGYIVTGNYMLSDNLRMTGRYLSASEVYGNPLAVDVLQIDLVAAF
ncbi:putative porin [Sphingobium sp. CAP-1]|uniref:putative porin n=1 Tax=Sphingobium sp. CAP-1 TaxID=2676077 RepID=UPI0012BB37F6|nr:putative porin [Sphingobium sp. CAP-1]QGP80468.1 hypothetical protein GL174_15145 [Sphingobium sp. CAP-1]